MGIDTINKEMLKAALKELIQEDPSILTSSLRELIHESTTSASTETAEQRRDRIQSLIQKDFDKYDDVFRALA